MSYVIATIAFLIIINILIKIFGKCQSTKPQSIKHQSIKPQSINKSANNKQSSSLVIKHSINKVNPTNMELNVDNYISNIGKKFKKPYIIGIAGASGSGKTYIANAICELCNKLYSDKNIIIISQDSYYKGGNEESNYDIPDSVDFNLLQKHLNKLLVGKSIMCPVYDFKTHCRQSFSTQIDANYDIIIVEGILVLTQDDLGNLFDTKIFVQADIATSIFRRISRDTKERNRTIDEIQQRYIKHVSPSYTQFIAPSASHADIIINNNEGNIVGLSVLFDHILNIINK